MENNNFENDELVNATVKTIGWQLISTAPKNENILLCQSQNGIIKTGRWHEYRGRFSTDMSGMDLMGITHWATLPTPPKFNSNNALFVEEGD